MADIKQVLVVNRNAGGISMRKGKIGAQCAHGTGKIYGDLFERKRVGNKIKYTMTLDADDPMVQWLDGPFAKICVYVNSDSELLAVYEKARKAGIRCALIVDAGHTEFGGNPTRTVVAIGPDYSAKIDTITGDLKLL